MKIFDNIKASFKLKQVNKKMIAKSVLFPDMNYLDVYLNTMFDLFTEIRRTDTQAINFLLHLLSTKMKVYYCECLENDNKDDWIRIDCIRPHMPVFIDIPNRKITSNEITADLIMISIDESEVISAYDEYKKGMKS